jgi:hypothetical protein
VAPIPRILIFPAEYKEKEAPARVAVLEQIIELDVKTRKNRCSASQLRLAG